MWSPLPRSFRQLLLAGLLLLLLPLVGLAQPASAPPWFPFQLDAQLALEVPAPLRQLAAQTVNGMPLQGYLAQTPETLLFLLHGEFPANKPLPADDILYTSLAQNLLTSSHAVGLEQHSFQVDSASGLRVDFRVPKTATDPPMLGSMWLLRLHHSYYVAQWLSAAPVSALVTAQKQQFIASWRSTHLPTRPPTSAELARLHVGEFRDRWNTLITRRDTMQTEVNTALGARIVYGLRWTSEGYDLLQRSSTTKYAAQLKAKVIHVRVMGIQGDTYWYQARMDDIVNTGSLQRMP